MPARKPLGRKNYGHIAHLPNSRVGLGDHHCEPGQARIATERRRDANDEVIVQEKLDGSNVGVARIDGDILPLNRAGYLANTSPYEQHHRFYDWALHHRDRFLRLLRDGERVCGEWLLQAHGTRYELGHEPFVAFDLMVDSTRTPFDQFCTRVEAAGLIIPKVLHRGDSLPVEAALERLGGFGHHGAMDSAEGAVWRVERRIPKRDRPDKVVVDFLVKYVRGDKVDGAYLPEVSGRAAVMNSYTEDTPQT